MSRKSDPLFMAIRRRAEQFARCGEEDILQAAPIEDLWLDMAMSDRLTLIERAQTVSDAYARYWTRMQRKTPHSPDLRVAEAGYRIFSDLLASLEELQSCL